MPEIWKPLIKLINKTISIVRIDRKLSKREFFWLRGTGFVVKKNLTTLNSLLQPNCHS
jgi:hypothetical protein